MLALTAVLIVAFCNLFLGLIVLLKNRGNFTNTSFGIFAFMMAVWVVCNYYSNNVLFSYQQLLWLKRVVIFMPGLGLYFLLLFSLEFTRYRYNRFRPFAISFGLFTLLISIMSTTPLFIAKIVPNGHIVTLKFGPLIGFYAVFITVLFLSIIGILAASVPRLTGPARTRTQIMGASLFIAIGITVITNLIMPVAFNNYSYILLGMISSFIIVGGFSYAIIHHRLFDIRTVVARAVAYLMLLVTLGVSYAIITFKVGEILFSHSHISTPQQLFNALTALVLAVTFQPLQRFFEKITDKIFYRDHYDPEVLMDQISHVLASEIDLVKLTRKVRNLLAKNIRVEHVNVVVLDNNKVFVETGHYVVSRLESLARDLGELRGRLLVKDEEPEGRRKEVLQAYGISVMSVLHTRDEKIGYLLFGEKRSADIYTNTDLQVIAIIADQLAVAIQNAKAYGQIQRFNRTLQKKVNDATKQLREANSSLQQLDHVKDEFISIASHQLRTPLTVVDGYLSNVLDGTYGTFNDQQRQALEVVQNRMRLTSGLVADLLNMSRMEAGRFFIDATSVDLNRVVVEELEQLRMKANEQGVTLVYTPPTQPVPLVNIDEQKTRQVIMNLIDNAINYTPKGTVKVTLDTVGNQVMFKVEDTGIGVPTAEQAKLFHKFFRATNAKKTRADGTGIGLYLVKRVIEQQGGNLIFTSEVGHGSTFGFRLPVAPDVPAKAPTHHNHSPKAAAPVKIAVESH